MPKPKSKLIDIELIDVPEDRQRKDMGDLESLATSILRRGLINPITLDAQADGRYRLIAGERRLEAHKLKYLSSIEARIWQELSPDEREVIELEENELRKQLTWQERAAAIQRVHRLLSRLNPEGWTQEATAEHMGYSSHASVSRALVVAEELQDRQVAAASNMEAAYNVIARRQSRQLADITNEIMAPKVQRSDNEGSIPSLSVVGNNDAVGNQLLPPDPIQCASFLTWAPAYSGPKFNFLHCDFPYGVNLQDSDQMSHDSADLYEDSEEVYWQLLQCLAENLDNICYPSAHMMFWFSMKFYRETLAFLSESTDFVVQPIPLVWHKSDNSGIIPDYRRGPRNTYEVCFIASRDDRFIIKPVANSYSAPTASGKIHASEKPEPVLRHFFQMFVDERTRLLDPTAGSGSSLRAADSMGAEDVRGLELDPTYTSAANNALASARRLRKVAI